MIAGLWISGPQVQAALASPTQVTSEQISTVIMIRNSIAKAVLIFYREALIYKAFVHGE